MCEQYFQYILSVNQSTLDLLAKELSEEEYKALIVDTEVLELNVFQILINYWVFNLI